MALGIALVALAVVLFVVLRDEDENGETPGAVTIGQPAEPPGADAGRNEPAPPSRPQIPTIAVRDGEPVGGALTLEYRSGERIRFRVRADEAGEVHVHGYEITEPVAAGEAVTLAFPADLQGGYEVELHGRRSGEFQIAELIVNPG